MSGARQKRGKDLGPAQSGGKRVAWFAERSRNLLRIDLGTQGCGTAAFGWVVIGYPEKVTLD